MLSVFMECGSEGEELAATLASLVPGAVEGLVREVVLLERAPDATVRKVADHAGCRLVGVADLRTAVEAAKGDWLLLMEPGARLQPGWIAAVAEHLEEAGRGTGRLKAGRFVPARVDRPGFLRRLAVRRTALSEGFLAPKAQLLGRAREAMTLSDMAKGLASVRLGAELRPPRRAKR